MCWPVFGRLPRAGLSTSPGGFRAGLSTVCLPVIESLRTPLGHPERVFASRLVRSDARPRPRGRLTRRTRR